MYGEPIQSVNRLVVQGQFDAQKRGATYGRIWSLLTGHGGQLLNLYQFEQTVVVHDRYDAGVQTVPIEKICGSEGRCHDFDAQFRPLQSRTGHRWISIAMARENNVALPLVELIQIDDRYFVRDGHHRISVAKAYGQLEIEAAVTIWSCTEAPAMAGPAQNSVYRNDLLIVIGRWLVTLGTDLKIRAGAQRAVCE